MRKSIGKNLILDVYNVNLKFLEPSFLLGLLKNLISVVQSTPLGRPIVKKVVSSDNPHFGYSIFQIIKESHIAFHTWPEYKYFALDIFSCKEFNSQSVIKLLKSNLNKEVKIRSKEYKRIVYQVKK
jgi:S-adenosylmethionine decarboxylase